MCRRIVAVVLIGAWIVLSGIDILEDIGDPNQVDISTANGQNSAPPGFGHRAPLANNIVESAHRNEQSHLTHFETTPVNLAFATIVDFRRSISLHKLFQIFQI